MSKSKREIKIARAWNVFNTAFREGFKISEDGFINPAPCPKTPREKGLNAGWQWQMEGKPCPADPMLAFLEAEKLFGGEA